MDGKRGQGRSALDAPAFSAARPAGLLWLWGPVFLYCVLIFELSSVSNVPALPGGMSDKLGHTLLYSGLGFLVARAATGGSALRTPWRAFVAAIGFAAFYGLSDEFHQWFVPLREFDLRDLAADVAGAGLGASAWWLWSILRRTRDAVRFHPDRP